MLKAGMIPHAYCPPGDNFYPSFWEHKGRCLIWTGQVLWQYNLQLRCFRDWTGLGGTILSVALVLCFSAITKPKILITYLSVISLWGKCTTAGSHRERS